MEQYLCTSTVRGHVVSNDIVYVVSNDIAHTNSNCATFVSIQPVTSLQIHLIYNSTITKYLR